MKKKIPCWIFPNWVFLFYFQ